MQGQPVHMHAPAPGTNYYAPPQQAQVIYPPPGNHQQQQYGGKVQAMEVQQQPQPQKPHKVLQSQPVNGAPDGGAGTIDEEAGGKAKYQDVWAAILFLLHLGFIIYLAAVPGWKALMSNDLTTADASSSEEGEPLGTELTKLYAGVAVVLAAAGGWSALWTGLLLRFAANIITAAIWGGVATSAVGAVLAVLAGNFVLAIVCAIFGAIQVCCVFWGGGGGGGRGRREIGALYASSIHSTEAWSITLLTHLFSFSAYRPCGTTAFATASPLPP